MDNYWLIIGSLVIISGFVLAVLFTSRVRRARSISVKRHLGRRYTVGYELGRGMNAVTYTVQDNDNLGRPLVAKLLLTPEDEPRITPNSFRRHIDRFQREMENLRMLQKSKYVVPVYDFQPDALRPFFVMEYCQSSLDKELKKGLPTMGMILQILIDVCRGLVDSHAENIKHRDLKPANILKYQGRWVLADFGMSLIGNEGSVVTVPESLPGTIPYTAPEVMYYPPSRIGPPADVFSLGVTLKEMLTGTSNWDRRPSELIQYGDKKRRKKVKLFDNLVEKMMSLRPEDRPDTVHEVAEALAGIFESMDIKGYEQLKSIKITNP